VDVTQIKRAYTACLFLDLLWTESIEVRNIFVPRGTVSGLLPRNDAQLASAESCLSPGIVNMFHVERLRYGPLSCGKLAQECAGCCHAIQDGWDEFCGTFYSACSNKGCGYLIHYFRERPVNNLHTRKMQVGNDAM